MYKFRFKYRNFLDVSTFKREIILRCDARRIIRNTSPVRSKVREDRIEKEQIVDRRLSRHPRGIPLDQRATRSRLICLTIRHAAFCHPIRDSDREIAANRWPPTSLPLIFRSPVFEEETEPRPSLMEYQRARYRPRGDHQQRSSYFSLISADLP